MEGLYVATTLQVLVLFSFGNQRPEVMPLACRSPLRATRADTMGEASLLCLLNYHGSLLASCNCILQNARFLGESTYVGKPCQASQDSLAEWSKALA